MLKDIKQKTYKIERLRNAILNYAANICSIILLMTMYIHDKGYKESYKPGHYGSTDIIPLIFKL